MTRELRIALKAMKADIEWLTIVAAQKDVTVPEIEHELRELEDSIAAARKAIGTFPVVGCGLEKGATLEEISRRVLEER